MPLGLASVLQSALIPLLAWGGVAGWPRGLDRVSDSTPQPVRTQHLLGSVWQLRLTRTRVPRGPLQLPPALWAVVWDLSSGHLTRVAVFLGCVQAQVLLVSSALESVWLVCPTLRDSPASHFVA